MGSGGGNAAKGSASAKAISLSDVPARQVISAASWGAWYKVNTGVAPEAILKAVGEGHNRAKEAEAQAQQEARETEALKTLAELKKTLTEEQLQELLKKA
jgi:hypothetical protein